MDAGAPGGSTRARAEVSLGARGAVGRFSGDGTHARPNSISLLRPRPQPPCPGNPFGDATGAQDDAGLL